LKFKNQNKHLDKNLRLALDIGTNSIGWALYDIGRDKKPMSIVGTGVRIFSSGRTPKDTTLNATRRQARLQRRQRDRYLQRRAYLLHLLRKYGLFPKDVFSSKKLECLNPYELRAKGLDEKLDLFHFGRALFHLNQRRGFKSNRKSGNDKESGIIAQSIKKSEEQLKEWGVRTYGEFLWKRFQKMQESRKHPGSQQEHWVLARKPIGAGSKDNYVVYAQRSMLESEFNKLWDSQARYHNKLKDNRLKEIFFKCIFYQRKLKKPIVGNCEYLTGEKRIRKALPSFQKFRILKELNNLAYNQDGHNYPIVEMKRGLEFRDHVIKKLFQKKDKIKFSILEKEFQNFFPDIGNFSRFNLDTPNRKYLEGELTSFVLSKIIPKWQEYSLEIQDRFVELLEGESKTGDFMEDDKDVLEKLKSFSEENNINLSENQLENCMNKLSKLPSDHGSYSKKVIDKIMPFLEKGELEREALENAGWHHSRYNGEPLDKLPYYPEVLKNHCVDMSRNPNKEDLRIPNPTVHIAFNQLKLLVNDIIRVYGRPMQIVVETARDLPVGKKTKDELKKRQKENRKRNEEAKEFIDEFKQLNNRSNRLRYQLWKEQNHTCVYSGKTISKSKLFTAELETDHILPYSRTLDDSFMNKVLVYKNSNQQKGNQTPFEAFSSNEEYWKGILQRVPKSKKSKFDKDAMKKFEKGKFLERQLNDTRYISKYATEYLTRICKEVWTVRGQTTALLRPLLQHEEKNRDDYRNHAKDALVVGLVDRSLVQHISNIAKDKEGTDKTRLQNVAKAIKKDVLPWPSFKEDAKKAIDKIIVSHRRRTKKEGQLHNATAYGCVRDVSDFSKSIDVIHYVDMLKKLDLDKVSEKKINNKIVSERIKKDFLEEVEKNQVLSKEFLINYHQKTGVRRVRLKETKKVIPIKNKFGKIYKYFNGNGNYAVHLFEKSRGKWDAKVIDTFSANQKHFKPIPDKERLMKGDMLFFDDRFWRLVKFDQNKSLIFVEHYLSGNPDELRKDDKTKKSVKQNTPASLQKSNPKRVDISPCGVVKLSEFVLINTDCKKSDQSA